MTENTTPPEKRSRPAKPEYGELAPEGWVNPVTQEPVTPEGSPDGSARAQTATPKRLDGVPHNLGVNPDAPKPQPVASEGITGIDLRGKKLLHDEHTEPVEGEKPAKPAKPVRAGQSQRLTDRIFTIVLLSIGALGALNVAGALMNLPQTFAQIYALYDLGPFAAPAFFGVLSTLGWMLPLGLWAVALIMSIQFMQRGKVAFYIPLIAGVAAAIVAVVLMSIAVTAAPELLTYFTDNGFSLEDLQ